MVVAASLVPSLLASQAGAAKTNNGTLSVGIPSQIVSLSPQPINGGKNVPFLRALYDPLINYIGGKPEPGLVQSWKISSNRLTIALNLQRRVLYSDGSPFNASAALWNIQWLQKPSTGAQGVTDLDSLTASVTGPYQVTLKLTHPLPDLLSLLAYAFVVKPGAPTSGVGTGPFMVKSFSPGQTLDLVKNPHYWQAGLPKLSDLNFVTYSDPASAELALRAGTINVDDATDLNQVRPLKNQGFRAVAVPPPGNAYLLVNTSTPGLGNPLVREALSIAFDRKAYNETQLDNLNQPIYTIWPPDSPVYSPSINRGSYNLGKAQALLHKAGVHALTVDVTTWTAEGSINNFLPIYQQDLAKIGVTLNIITTTPAAGTSEGFAGKWSGLITWGTAFENADPALAFDAVALAPGSTNIEHFAASKYARMITAAAAQQNASERIAEYQAISRYVQEQAFVIPLVSGPTYILTSSSVRGLVTSQLGPDYTHVQVNA